MTQYFLWSVTLLPSKAISTDPPTTSTFLAVKSNDFRCSCQHGQLTKLIIKYYNNPMFCLPHIINFSLQSPHRVKLSLWPLLQVIWLKGLRFICTFLSGAGPCGNKAPQFVLGRTQVVFFLREGVWNSLLMGQDQQQHPAVQTGGVSRWRVRGC